MSMVITCSFAILMSLPGWLRSLENGPKFRHLANPVVESTSTGPSPGAVASRTPGGVADLGHQQQALADYLARRYRVSSEALERFVRLAYSAGQMTKLDPLLILAVMAVESSFNPIAESGMGAKGLMQVIPQFHQDKLRSAHGTELNVLDPETNILVGAKVLREYASKTGGNYAAALGMYVGFGPDPANPYASKVLSERERLEAFLRRALDQQPAARALPVQERT
jgi:soluble lytic murein transglycosylase-like protein